MVPCNACRSPALWAASISRVKNSKKNAQPARLYLCDEHAATLSGNDPNAQLRLLPREEEQ